MKLSERLKSIISIEEDVCEDDGWTDELCVLFTAWLIENVGGYSVGLIEEGRKRTKLTPMEVAHTMATAFQQPWFTLDPQYIPFPDSSEMWWKAVARVVNEGKTLGNGGKPNYMLVMRYWKNMIQRKYGFRPKRTKEMSMKEQIKKHVKMASAKMGKELAKAKPKRGSISAAARLLAGRRVQKKEFERLEKEAKRQRRSYASKKGWETRRAKANQ